MYIVRNIIQPILNRISRNNIYNLKFAENEFQIKGGFKFFYSEIENSLELDFLNRLDLKNKIVYDIGADIGLFTLFFASKVENGFVYSFEPNINSFNRIKDNINLNKYENIKLLNLAVGERNEELQLSIRKASGASGSLNNEISQSINKEFFSKKVNVKVRNLETILIEYNIQKPDFIKIDVEGYEVEVLRGMKEIFLNKPDFYIEIHGIDYSNKLNIATSVFNILKANNYSILHVESNKYIITDNIYDMIEGHIYCTIQKIK